MSSSESSSSTTFSSKQDPIELEKKSHDKSHSKSKSNSSSSSAKPVHEAENKRVSKELLRDEQHAKEEHKPAHEHQAAAPVKQEVQIDKKKKASEGKVWVGTDDHPQTEEIALADMTAPHLAKLFGFKTIQYLVSHDNEYIAPDANDSFVYRVKYGMSYLISGLEKYEDKCIRCRKLFNLNQKKTCRFHPGERVLIDKSKNKKKKKKKGEEDIVMEPILTEVWSCCKQEEIISSGCCKVKGHVGMLEKNYKPKPLGDEPLDPQYDVKKKPQARKKREARMEKFKPWTKSAPDTKGVAPGAPAANTNQKPPAPKAAQEEFKLKEKPVSEDVREEKKEVVATKKSASSSADDSSSSESGSSSSSSSVSSSTTKSD